MNDLKVFLDDFLTTIEYSGNKENFINELIIIIYSGTIDELLNKLPQNQQIVLKEKLKNDKSPQTLLDILNTSFDKKSLEEALKRNSEKAFVNYLNTIDPALSDEHRVKLKKYFTSFSSQE